MDNAVIMQLKQLELTHVRVFEQADFEFQPGMNLLVGINGAGKSTILDMLRFILSQVLPEFTAARKNPIYSDIGDITVGHDWLYSVLKFDIAGLEMEYEVREWRKKIGTIDVKTGDVRQQTDERRDIHRLRSHEKPPKGLKSNSEQPLSIFFSPHRSLLDTKQSKGSGQAAAFADALAANRGLRLQYFAHWFLAQEELAREGSTLAVRHLNVLNDVVTAFLDNCTNLRAVREPEITLLIDKGNSTLDISQLSDGERSMVALVFDLAQRLAQANPKLDEPLRDGKAVVLIDELDLHLHPNWQRTICERLTTTFPNCQFIATTHSPFVIQSLRPGQLINLSSQSPTDEYVDKSIEDIAEGVMGIPIPQKSIRYQQMMEVAEEYYRTLAQARDASGDELAILKDKLDELSIPYSDDPAFTAFLKFQRENVLRENETSQ
jgi:predicted ATP-binding protein involved in virulence